MANGTGLLGDKSSTQSAVIVPKPESKHIYYVFTADNVPGIDGVRYTIVDMSLQNGEGKITDKNILLQAPVTEKLTAVKHQNNKDIWVIAHGYNSNAFYAYLVTAEGIINAANPVLSKTGTIHHGNLSNNAIGYMKASPDGRRLALGVRGMKLYELFDFDRTSGIVSNPLTFKSSDFNSPYGVEFSPDGSKLYINSSQNPKAGIYQIDLTNGNTVTLIGTSKSEYAGSLQLGPDGKIYFARYQGKYLGIIHTPNAAGIACNYEDDGLYLGGKTSLFGLPNFIQSYFYKPVFTYTKACVSSLVSFSLTNPSNIEKVEWIFDDPVLGVNNISDKIEPTHIYSKYGSFEVILAVKYIDGTSFKTSQIVTIPPPPVVNLGRDTILCPGAVLKLNATIPDAISYLWQDGSAKSSFTVNKPGIYWVEASNGLCTTKDSIHISYKTPLEVNLGKDTTLYKVNSLLLQVNQPDIKCVWQNGSTANTFTVTSSGNYWVEVTNGCESMKDEIRIDFLPAMELNLGKDTTLCTNQVLTLQAPSYPATYLWQDGSTKENFKVSKTGLYWVEISNQFEKVRDSIMVSYIASPHIDLGKDTTLYAGTSLELKANATHASYLWQDGSTRSFFTVSKPGIYWVEGSNPCGSTRDSIVISFKAQNRNISLGKDTTLCEGNTLLLQVNSKLENYRWQDGSTINTCLVKKPGVYWVETKVNSEVIRDSIWVEYQGLPSINLGGNTTLCNNETLLLNAQQSGMDATYVWQDGSTEATFTASEPGLYWVEVTTICGTAKDSVAITCPACITDSMPNVITPNGDGDNDSFIIPCIQEQVWAIEIYNRWGKLVFYTKAYQGEWQAENLESGIYFYTLTNQNLRTPLKGIVHVLR
jgi:gliding motility-associated-like protein